MKYEDMSNFDINKEVAKITDNDWHHDSSVVFKDNENGNTKEFDPCNNPSDAWPIILDAGISINHGKSNLNIQNYHEYDQLKDEWVDIWFVGAGIPEAQEKTNDKSKVLRAAMICFLKMKDAE